MPLSPHLGGSSRKGLHLPTELSFSFHPEGGNGSHLFPNICQQRTGNSKRGPRRFQKSLQREKRSFMVPQPDKLLAQVWIALLLVLVWSCHPLDDRHSNKTTQWAECLNRGGGDGRLPGEVWLLSEEALPCSKWGHLGTARASPSPPGTESSYLGRWAILALG